MATTGRPVREHEDVPEYEPITVPEPVKEPAT